ncbi:MAG: hypothetical protein NTY35_03355 [Planctomycetota bacterium]|nr:hypothetical protein [Planctomycetota bacterium]
MIALATLFAASVAVSETPAVLPRTIEWAELGPATFDRAYLLPEELEPADEGEGLPVDLARAMRRLALERYASKPGATETLNCLGDVVRAVRAAGGGAQACERVLARVREVQPGLAKELEPWASELLCDTALRAPKWNPDRDSPCDGLVFARPLTLGGRKEAAWKKRDRDDLVQQAATLIYADLEAIKAAENDYRSYPSRPGASYERIGPIADTYVQGKDPDGGPFSALRILFETDLPFPFSSFTCDLHVLNRVDDRGRLVCDVYSVSKDFNWLAGRDHFFPVRASDGAWVATLVVRWYGFDLRGVPDDDDARRGALRSSLGGLRLGAEEAFGAHGGPPRTVEGGFPSFQVFGTPVF